MRRLLAALVMALTAGLTLADLSGNLLFEDVKLFRDVRVHVEETQVPALPTAACASTRIQAQVVRTIDFRAGGWSNLDLHLADFGLGAFLDNGGQPFHTLAVQSVGALDFQTPYFPPGTVISFVFVYDIDETVTSVDPAVLALLQSGSRVQYAVGGGGGSYGGGGSWSMRSSASITSRFTFGVTD